MTQHVALGAGPTVRAAALTVGAALTDLTQGALRPPAAGVPNAGSTP